MLGILMVALATASVILLAFCVMQGEVSRPRGHTDLVVALSRLRRPDARGRGSRPVGS